MSKQYQTIYLHGKIIATNKLSPKRARIVREMVGLENLIQQGIMVDIAINRLKELSEKMK